MVTRLGMCVCVQIDAVNKVLGSPAHLTVDGTDVFAPFATSAKARSIFYSEVRWSNGDKVTCSKVTTAGPRWESNPTPRIGRSRFDFGRQHLTSHAIVQFVAWLQENMLNTSARCASVQHPQGLGPCGLGDLTTLVAILTPFSILSTCEMVFWAFDKLTITYFVEPLQNVLVIVQYMDNFA